MMRVAVAQKVFMSRIKLVKNISVLTSAEKMIRRVRLRFPKLIDLKKVALKEGQIRNNILLQLLLGCSSDTKAAYLETYALLKVWIRISKKQINANKVSEIHIVVEEK